eukprot:TRINITY_DN24598_c0_g1_i1.p1 TRINITY_DN24598_c0_g1~~TRINITY_DN24598_c0_g1_i1.p1  ORF type:complete len:231 (+),score=69.16 TRINITY_DN24598_c0_g1_i1:51-743(+)
MTEVESPVPEELTLDLGNMMLVNKSQCEGYSEDVVAAAAQRDAQVLVAQLFGLPSEKADGGRLAKLPFPSSMIPREKPPPKEKELTKWEEFKKEKGLKSRKKAKRVYDEDADEWIGTYGAKRARHEREHTWIKEVPDNYVPKVEGGDAFLDEQMERKERVKKQKAREAANQRRSRESQRLNDIDSTSSRLATASMGKFDNTAKSKSSGKTTKNLSKTLAKKSKVAQRKRR